MVIMSVSNLFMSVLFSKGERGREIERERFIGELVCDKFL